MAIRGPEERPVEYAAFSGKPAGHADLLEDMRLLWLDVRGLTHDHLKLFTLEARRAGHSLASMLVAGVMMAVLLLAVWFGLMAAAVLALMHSHLIGAIGAVLVIAAANLIGALLLFWFIRRKSRYLLFPETVRSFKARESV